MQNCKVHAYVISLEFSAVNRRRPSCEMPLGPGAKKVGCFCKLMLIKYHFIADLHITESQSILFLTKYDKNIIG